jgi:anaerobic selenocysteine-containing dehydrogenase
VSDYFMTPTAALADIVLPVGNYLEYDGVRQLVFLPQPVQIMQKVAQIGERWSDTKIYLELAKKLGLREYFWNDEEELNDAILRPAGVTFEEFRQIGILTGSKQYRLHEKGGFKTPSGKVEIYSERLKKWGFDPLPVYNEMPETPFSDPDLAQEYPLVFTTYKPRPWSHSQDRQIDSLRSLRPEPIVSIHPETATKLGINENDMVYIETKRGRIKQKAFLANWLDPRVVVVDDAWWFPEKGPAELYGWAESNNNVLTSNQPPYSRELGSTNLRGILCKVYKA